MNDINVCCLHFFVADVPEKAVRTTVRPATGQQFDPWAERSKPGTPTISNGIRNGER